MSVAFGKVGLTANFGVLVFKASLLYYSGGPTDMISFNNNIIYYTWQIWALIVEFCNCHVGGVLGVLGSVEGLHLTWLYSANWLYTTLIIQKWKEIPTFSWRIQNGCQIHPIIYIPWCIWGDRSVGSSWGRSANCHSWPLDVNSNVKLPFLTTRCQ